jgi:hypothetical protein
MGEPLVVPSICSRDVACVECPVLRTFQEAYEESDVLSSKTRTARAKSQHKPKSKRISP